MVTDAVSHIRRPRLRQPFLILSFSGWSDAGSSATSAVRYLIEQLLASELAKIDPEEYYDFSVQRPHVRLVDGQREIEWPSYDFHYYKTGSDLEQDFIFASGAEPHLHWKSFASTVLDLARQWKVARIITLGALLDEVLYTKPVPLNGFSSDPGVDEAVGLHALAVPGTHRHRRDPERHLPQGGRAAREPVGGAAALPGAFPEPPRDPGAGPAPDPSGSGSVSTRVRWNAPPASSRTR